MRLKTSEFDFGQAKSTIFFTIFWRARYINYILLKGLDFVNIWFTESSLFFLIFVKSIAQKYQQKSEISCWTDRNSL